MGSTTTLSSNLFSDLPHPAKIIRIVKPQFFIFRSFSNPQPSIRIA